MAVRISKERFYSDVYLTTQNHKLGKPLVINIRRTYSDERKEAEKDLQRIKETIPRLGFNEPFVLDSQDGGLEKKDDFLRKVVDFANNEEMTTKSDVFLCIIMAYGEANFIYTAGQNPEKVDISDVISIFKADRCPGLICKPKIFIIHTDDRRLRMIRPERQHRDLGDIQLVRVPVEGDTLVYHSQLSANYVQYIRARKPKVYCELMDNGLVEILESIRRRFDVKKNASSKREEINNDGDRNENSKSTDLQNEDEDVADSSGCHNNAKDDNEGDKESDEDEEEDTDEEDIDEDVPDDDNEGDEQSIGTHFIYTLCQTAKVLIDEGCFDLIKWIFQTNKHIHDVMKLSKRMRPRRDDGEWKPKPRSPLCTIQLTKKLVVRDLANRAT